VVVERGGNGLLEKFGGSLQQALIAVYSDHHWDARLFSKKSQRFWHDKYAQRRFLLDLGKHLGFKQESPDPWYGLTSAVMKKNGGTSMLNLHKGKVASMLMETFPEFDWQVWKFKKLPSSLDSAHLSKALRHIEGKFVREPADWYRISNKDLESEGLLSMFARAGGMLAVLRRFYPHLVELKEKSPVLAHH
jgi:hypothetical protein